MNTLAKHVVVTLALFAFAVCAMAGEDTSPPNTSTVQTIKVNGTDLTGLNGSALTNLINQAKQQGTTNIVVDLDSVSHMTPVGMESLTAGAERFGPGNFAVANLSGQPAELAQREGAGRFQTYASVKEAVAALKD